MDQGADILIYQKGVFSFLSLHRDDGGASGQEGAVPVSV